MSTCLRHIFQGYVTVTLTVHHHYQPMTAWFVEIVTDSGSLCRGACTQDEPEVQYDSNMNSKYKRFIHSAMRMSLVHRTFQRRTSQLSESHRYFLRSIKALFCTHTRAHARTHARTHARMHAHTQNRNTLVI